MHAAVGSFDRWQADGKLPKDQQRGYRGVFHALYRIARDEGVLAYWRGGGTTGESRQPLPVAKLFTTIAADFAAGNDAVGVP